MNAWTILNTGAHKTFKCLTCHELFPEPDFNIIERDEHQDTHRLKK